MVGDSGERGCFPPWGGTPRVKVERDMRAVDETAGWVVKTLDDDEVEEEEEEE